MSNTGHLPELEFLRSQVAELSRKLAERDQSMQDLRLCDLQNIMETFPDIMFTLDTQGNMVKWNRRVGDVTGYSPEELLNKPALAFVPPEEQTRTAAAIQQAFTEGSAELDGHLLTKEHRLIPYHWTGALLKDPHGEPIGITGVGRDVSDKKRAEEELRQQRRHLVDAQALAHLGSWDWDVDTGEVEWSDEQFRIFGYAPGAIAVTYDTFLASLHPDDHDRVLAAINDALLGKRPCDVEYRIVRPNGEDRSIHARGDVHRDATGHPLSMAGTVIDITERKQVEEALRASEERWQLAARGSNDGIWDWNIQTGKVFYSSRWKAMRGFADHEIADSVDERRSRIHPDDLDRVLQSIDTYFAKQTPGFCEEYRAQRKDGSYMWILDRGIALWADDGTATRMVGSECDITERKQLAEREASRVRQLKKLYELSMTLPSDPGVVFEHAVRIIGELFKVPVVCLSEIVGQELYFKSVYVNGQTFADAGHCSLAITPCATVEQTKDLRVFDRVMERFPQASFLRDHQAFSYCGFPALDNEGRVVAVACLLDDKPHEFSKEEQDLLRIFGQRIAVEIERSHYAAEQKRASDELRRSHALIRQIIDTDPNFIFAKDREGRFTLVNQAVADAYGSTVEDLIGKTDADFNRKADEGTFFRGIDPDVMNAGEDRFIPEEIVTDAYGNRRWVQTVKRPILDETGRAIMVLGAATDITDRKRMEEALRQRERDLRAAIEERERISQDLHDGILQSLFAVGLTLETTKSMMSPRNRKMPGAPLDQAIDQLNRVMREIRNFIAGLGSDLLQGKDLPTALQHMLESLTQNHATRVRLAVEDRAAQAVSAEQSRHLLLVIQEAVSNCIRHGRAQEATVSLKMLKQGVRLSIRDNGSGFNPDTAKGTGHGLSNMAARAQKIGGRFTVFSRINEGTRVVLDLPKEASYGRR